MGLKRDIRESLTFGFEQTFTIPEWWTEPGFVATSNTPLKLEKMEQLAREIARQLDGSFRQSDDIYGHLQFETFDREGSPSFIVTMDPGCIEVKTQPLVLADVESTMAPLFAASECAGLVPYRNWWYGVRTGTEGGCHVNMGGHSRETNPLFNDPSLVLKYAAFFHNNPWIHYPFMGVDVGPGGNAMRMDEHPADPRSGNHDSVVQFRELREFIVDHPRPSAHAVAEWFADTSLAKDKHSAPSLYKFKEPLFLIEDRAVEALRSAAEFRLVAELRVRILEFLQTQEEVDALYDFGPTLHEEKLSSTWLWEGFVAMARRLGLPPEGYRVFFDRQFPVLSGGESVPAGFTLREGRRPRVITSIQKRGDLIISKTIDTNHGRLELHTCSGDDRFFVINGRPFSSQGGQLIVDYHRPRQNGVLDIRLRDSVDGPDLECARFHLNNMMFTDVALTLGACRLVNSRAGYVKLEIESGPPLDK